MVRHGVEAASNDAQEGIGGEMCAPCRGTDGHGNTPQDHLTSFPIEGYCRRDVDEKAMGIARWFLGSIAFRELLPVPGCDAMLWDGSQPMA